MIRLLAVLAGAFALGSAQQLVGVGMYMLNIAEVDPVLGSFTADFYLYLQSSPYDAAGFSAYPLDRTFCDGLSDASSIATCEVTPLFNNAQRYLWTQSVSIVDGLSNTTNQYRVKCSFRYTSFMEDYPFETETLRISLEDPNRDDSLLVYEPLSSAFSGITRNLQIPGWDISADWTAETHQITYPQGRTFSRFDFLISINRPKTSSFIKTLLPGLLILTTQYFAFALPPAHASIRLSIAGAGLTSLALVHVNVQALTPATNQLFFSDRAFIVGYAVCVSNAAVAIAMLKAKDFRNKAALADRVYQWGELLAYLITPVWFTALLVVYFDASVAWVLAHLALAAAAVYWLRSRQSSHVGWGWRHLMSSGSPPGPGNPMDPSRPGRAKEMEELLLPPTGLEADVADSD